MRHKYLNKIGVSSYEPDVYGTTEKNNQRVKSSKLKKQRRKHGFDEREVRNLHFTLATWLYEHLVMFKKKGREFHKMDIGCYDIPVLHDIPKDKLTPDRIGEPVTRFTEELMEKHTLLECIDLTIKYLKVYIISTYGETTENRERRRERLLRGYEAYQCALKILTEILETLFYLG